MPSILTIPAASLNVGSKPGTLAAGNDARFPTIPQPAIPDLNVGTLTLLTEAITAIGSVQAKVNTILAELRAAGIISS